MNYPKLITVYLFLVYINILLIFGYFFPVLLGSSEPLSGGGLYAAQTQYTPHYGPATMSIDSVVKYGKMYSKSENVALLANPSLCQLILYSLFYTFKCN